MSDPLGGVAHKIATIPACSAPETGSSKYWYEEIEHGGESSFLATEYKNNYKVFRNVVTDFGADNTGQKDSSEAIQAAINGMLYVFRFYRGSC